MTTGFSADSPCGIAERCAGGAISREQTVDELARWPFVFGRPGQSQER